MSGRNSIHPNNYPAMMRFVYCPICATKLQVEMMTDSVERLRCPDCRWTHFPEPQVGVNIVVEYQGGIVLLQHAIGRAKGHWVLPSGHVEYGEEPDAAARQEVAEETGLSCGTLHLLDVFTHQLSSDDPFYLVFSYYCRGHGTIALDYESDDYQIAAPEDAPALYYPSQQRALDAYLSMRDKQLLTDNPNLAS